MNRNNVKGDIETFLILVRRGESEYKLRGIIDRAPVNEVTSWTDRDGLDLMHQVIIANNLEAAQYLLRHGFFVRPHLPASNPYSHLAALLGQRAMLQLLLQHRPDDFYPCGIPVKLPDQIVETISAVTESHPDTEIKLKGLDDVDSTSSSSAKTSSSSSSKSSKATTNSKPSRPSSSSSTSSSSSKRIGSATKTSAKPTSSSTTATTASSSSSSSSTAIPKFHIESLPTFLSNVQSAPSHPVSPLDIASRTGKLECVKVILNQCVLKRHAEDTVDGLNPNSSDVSLACVADNPRALALILHRKTPDKSDWESAVEVCLHHARPECLDILLSLGVETRHMFKSTNFYHILFTSAAMRGVKCYPRMAPTTEVLIKHGHNVNTKMPSRTFPLYSLLANAFCFRDYHNTSYYIQALRILLKNGASPNWDEVEFEKKHPRQAANKVIGRNAYSSGLHCLLETAERYSEDLDSPALAVQFIEDCASVLMNSVHASMNVVGCVGDPKHGLQGNILHQLAKSSVSLGANAEIFRCVLRHGADPNVKVADKYAINVYFDMLFKTMKYLQSSNHHFKTSSVTRGPSPSHAHTSHFSTENAQTILRLCGFMVPSTIKDCLRLFLKDHGKESSPMIKPYVELVKQELETRGQQVQTLVRASSWSVWKACKYRGDNVHTLKVSSELKTFILPMEF